MNITLNNVKISELYDGYKNKDDDGVVGYSGKLDIRPAYQREFVYKEKERNAVIDTIQKGYPLNVMYWVKKIDASGVESFELLDGQQRTISICSYISGDYSVNGLYFHNLPKNKQDEILEYELMVYTCEGTDSEKLEWFRTINIAGLKLTDQELRNSIYTGPWLSHAKAYFSKLNCVAYQRGGYYLNGQANRQEYLETALRWISNDDIEGYMAKHQLDKDADELRQYFMKVINWIEANFIVRRKEMKGLEWGILYNKYNTNQYNSNDLEKSISELMLDEEVTNKKGIYEYLLSSKILGRCLSIRTFTPKDKAEAFERQKKSGTSKATCPKCADDNKLYDIDELEADHIVPWSKGGKTTPSNCQLLCKYHNGLKSNN